MSDPIRDSEVSSVDSPEAIFWGKELDLATRRESKWRKEAEKVVKLYEGGAKTENSFNILYSNTETLMPACYNQLPRPIVERRYKDADPLAKASSTALERALSYLMDSPDAEYDPFNSLIEQSALGAFVPGRGITRFKYDPTFEGTEDSLGDEGETEGDSEDEGGGGEGEAILSSPESGQGKRVTYETVCGEDIDYDSFLMGYARRWVNVPWISFIHEMTKEDAEVSFGLVAAARLTFAPPSKKDPEGWKKQADSEGEGENNRGSEPVAEVYEIWHKGKKEVVFYAKEYPGKLIKTVQDPLELSGFYPCPEPLQFLLKRSGLTPSILYKLYEEQAKELNNLSRRINRVLNAMKVRGFYDGSIQGLSELLKADDNTLIAAKNVAQLQDGKTLENSIWMMPLDKLIVVLQQLLQGRESCKQTIYEITGIADIMRGQGQASETATAQNIKNQWGTLRMKRMQKAVQNYVRSCLRIMGEIVGKHFNEATFAGMTNLDYATQGQVAQATQTMQAVQQQMLQLQQAPQAPPMPGQPPAQPQIPPQLQQAGEQAQAILAKPKWADVIALLRNDLQRNYRIDIETNSTIDATSQEDKANINDAMTAIANTMQSFMPLVQSGVIPVAVLKSMLLTICRRFEFGRQMEESIMAMPDQVPPQPQPEAQKQAEALMQKAQQEDMQNQQERAKLTTDQQAFQASQQQAAEKMQMDADKAKGQNGLENEKLVMQIQQMLDKHEMAVQKLLLKNEPKPVPDTSAQAGAAAAGEAKQKAAQAKADKQNEARHKQMTDLVTQSNSKLAEAIASLTSATLTMKKA